MMRSPTCLSVFIARAKLASLGTLSLVLLASFTLGACERGASEAGSASAAVAEGAQATAGAESSVPDKLPTAPELFAAHVEAIGGAAALAKVKSLHIESEIEIPARGIGGTSDVWWQEGRFLLVEGLAQLGENQAGYDGERVWTRDAFNSLRDLRGKEAELYRRGSSPFLIAEWERHFESAETVGRREVEGHKLFDVRARSPLGQEMMLSFDVQNGLLFESAFDEVGPGIEASDAGARRVVTRAEDYRVVGGVLFAHSQTTRAAVGELVHRIKIVEINPPIDAARFDHPQAGERVPADPTKQRPPSLD